MKLVSIVPRFFPLVDGIGDYALGHARSLRDYCGVDTCFIVADPEWQGATRVEGFEVTHLSRRVSNNLMHILPEGCDSTVVLHYGGYGYARRGCPVWLVTALERWRKASGERSLVTIFHELYATGRVWTSSFWLSPLQKNLTARLAGLSDHSLTSLESYVTTLSVLNPNTTRRPYCLPVFSNIGEPYAPPPLDERRRRLVVFGTRGRRIEVYKRSAGDLNRICRALDVNVIADVGRPIEADLSNEMEVPVIAYGELSGDKVSELLLDSVAGVIDYPAAILGKSGIFAAYCAHRVIPIVATYGDALPADGLHVNTHYWGSEMSSEHLSLAGGQTVADRALDWYRTHDLSTHARVLAGCLLRNGPASNGR